MLTYRRNGEKANYIMEKSNELKAKLTETFLNKQNWNREIAIDGETFIYISAENKIRRIVNQPSGKVAVLVACFVLDKFIWCC